MSSPVCPSPPGGSENQPTVLVGQGDRNAIHLGLADEVERFSLFQTSATTLDPVRELLVGRALVQGEHGHLVGDRVELLERRPPDPLGGRIVGHEIGMIALQSNELVVQRVVLRVGDLWRIEHVVTMVMVAYQPTELADAAPGSGPGDGHARLDMRRRENSRIRWR